MTAPRRPRSASLLVGSTPSMSLKVQSAGQSLSRFRAKVRWRRLRALLSAASSSSALGLLFERRDPLDQAGAVGGPAALIPGGEQPSGDLQAGRAELLLGGEGLAVGGEVPEQVRPADLAALGLKSAVG